LFVMMELDEFLHEWNNGEERILVHTSGSTGKPKPIWVEKKRMEASARITCDFLGLSPGDTALLCLPLDYIAGKMMVVRSQVRELNLLAVPPSAHPLKNVADRRIDFAAMVPNQVWKTLQVAEERQRLMRIRHIIIGGGSIDEQLAEQLRGFPNAVWSTYGMTETLSHIALRRLSGRDASQWYTPFPSVQLSAGSDGCLIVDAPLVSEHTLHTNDIVQFREGQSGGSCASCRQFRILGRKDNVICSGGIKIQAEEVERMLKPYIATPFLITKQKDAVYGEIVVLVAENADEQNLRLIASSKLPKYYQPKRILTVSKIMLTETGKPRRDIALYSV
jgi:O-succinylbenzoic acid--CoA ligase